MTYIPSLKTMCNWNNWRTRLKWAGKGKGVGGKGGGATQKRLPTPKFASYADMSRSAKADLPEGSVHTIRLPDGSLTPLENSSYFKWTAIRQGIVKSMHKLKTTVRPRKTKERRKTPTKMIRSVATNTTTTTPTSTHYSSTTPPNSTGSAETPISATKSLEAPPSKTEPPLSSLREDASQDSTGAGENDVRQEEPKVVPPSLPSKTKKLKESPKVKQANINIFGAKSPVAKWSSTKALYEIGSNNQKSASTRALQQPVTSVNNSFVGEDSLQLVTIQGEIEPTERSGSGRAKKDAG